MGVPFSPIVAGLHHLAATTAPERHDHPNMLGTGQIGATPPSEVGIVTELPAVPAMAQDVPQVAQTMEGAIWKSII